MYTEERRRKIVEILKEKSPLAVNDIIEMVDGSPATIRRDLTFLHDNGIIVRTRGYAKYIQPEVVHQIEFSDEKLELAAAAAAMVSDGDTIMMDSGSCTMAMACQLKDRKNLTVVTNSLSVATVLALTDVTVHMTGGILIGREEALVGSTAERFISEVRAPILFLSTTGIRGTEGLSCVTPFQAAVKHAFIRSAKRKVLILEKKKQNMDALTVFADFSEIDCVITREPLDNPLLTQRLQNLGVEIVVTSNNQK